MDNQMQQLWNEQKDTLAAIVNLAIEKKLQVFGERIRQLEENNQRLMRQEEDVKELLKDFGERLGSIENNLGGLQTQIDQVFRATISLERRVFKGSYDNWPLFGKKEFYLMPLSQVKMKVSELENLDVTVDSQREKGMAIINQFICKREIIKVTKNLRFPFNGEYYCVSSDIWNRSDSRLHRLYRRLEKIDSDCSRFDYEESKIRIFNECKQMVEGEGWKNTYENYLVLRHQTAPEARLDIYLWNLCFMINIEKLNDILQWYGVYNVTSFEEKHNLTWTLKTKQ